MGALVALLSAAGLPAVAQTVRIATAGDAQSMDPFSTANAQHTRVVHQIYESLVGRDQKFALEPALATTWQMTAPTAWRFKLRDGVRFHDGSAFTADDAVYSLKRALEPAALRPTALKGVTAVRAVDPLTVELMLEAPDAALPEKLHRVAMVSRAWGERQGAARSPEGGANGTGPFRLERHDPDQRTVLTRNRDWWGTRDTRNGNVQQVEWITIRSDSARLAALDSGQVDLVMDPPLQDIARLKADAHIVLQQMPDFGLQLLAFDLSRPVLPDSDIRDRNPFTDVRVRRAVAHAINVPLIADRVLGGQAVATGAILSPLLDGVGTPADSDKPLPYDPARSRLLLAEAGYPNGFSVPLDCVPIAWREQVCQAVAAMLTQVGVRTSVRSNPVSTLAVRLGSGGAAFAEMAWTATPDAWGSLNALFHSVDAYGSGSANSGRYSNPKVDLLIDSIRTEADRRRRRAMVSTVLKLVADDMPVVPLYRRVLTWAMGKQLTVVQWPDDRLELRWVQKK